MDTADERKRRLHEPRRSAGVFPVRRGHLPKAKKLAQHQVFVGHSLQGMEKRIQHAGGVSFHRGGATWHLCDAGVVPKIRVQELSEGLKRGHRTEKYQMLLGRH